MEQRARYISLLLERYRRIPGTTGRVLSVDRRAFGPNPEANELIRTLGYFLPVIAEVLANPPDPPYLLHLERRLRRAALYLAN